MLEYLTKDNITFALALLGSIGTLFTCIINFLVYRKNLRIKLISSTYKKTLHRLILVITFENHSRLPITITSVSATMNNKELELLSHPHCVGEYTQKHGNEVVDRKFTYNLDIPVGIQQLGAVSGHILFDVSPTELEKLSTPLTLSIHSTRGRAQKIELQPNQIKRI
ncbi:MAG: hypothetical protein J6A75_11070 [Lachnospiraceae bacterium]|nr:hypothetical protein [Lachnospiraceae bacterium]